MNVSKADNADIMRGLVISMKLVGIFVALVGVVYIGLIIITLIMGVVASVALGFPGIPESTNTTITEILTGFETAVVSISDATLIVIGLIALAVILVVFKPWIKTGSEKSMGKY